MRLFGNARYSYMFVSTRIVTLALFLCLSFSVAAQKPDAKKKKNAENKYPQSGPVQVRGNLLVLDAQEKYVENLKLEDIKIFEDGVEQKITRIDKKVPPMHIGLVVDNSGSLRTYIDHIVQGSKIVITNLQDGDGSFVIRFVSSEKVEIVQNYTTNKARLFEAVENFYVEGGQSAIIDGLYLAAQQAVEWEKKAPGERFAIILITDGENRNSYYDLPAFLSMVDGSGVQIFPLLMTGELTDKYSPSTKEKFGLSNARQLARVLALKTGGIASFVETKQTDETVLQALKPIFIELRSQYVFAYESTNQKRDGLARTLTVEIADGPGGAKRKGFIRESFVVPVD